MEENSIFYDRLIKLIVRSGKSFNSIERDLGYPRNSLHNYKNGAEPSGTRLVELAEYFNTSPSYLMGKDRKNNFMDPEKYFLDLPIEDKLKLLKVSQEWAYDFLGQSLSN